MRMDVYEEKSCIFILLLSFKESALMSILDSMVFACKRSKRRQSSFIIGYSLCLDLSFTRELSKDFIGMPFIQSIFYLFRESMKEFPFFADACCLNGLGFASCLRYFMKFQQPESSRKAEGSSLLDVIQLKLSFQKMAASLRVIQKSILLMSRSSLITCMRVGSYSWICSNRCAQFITILVCSTYSFKKQCKLYIFSACDLFSCVNFSCYRSTVLKSPSNAELLILSDWF